MLAFQSGLSVAIAAALPSGERRAAVISVVFRNSSSAMAGFAGWAEETAAVSARKRENGTHKDL
jgi:hypothetical protein